MIMASRPGSSFKQANNNSNNNYSTTSFPIFSDKENVNIFNPEQQQQKSKIFSFSSSPPQKQSSYEQRFRSGATSSNPMAKIFGSSSSSTTTTGGQPSGSPAGRTAAKQREIFLNRVRRDRDNGRFNARGESVMMMEYLSEQRRWGERMLRNAQEYRLDAEDDELEVGEEEEEIDPEQYALDEFLSQQPDEIPEDSLPTANHHLHASLSSSPPPGRSDHRSSFYGDDEIDYDDLFMDLAGDRHQDHVHSQDMDMSG